MGAPARNVQLRRSAALAEESHGRPLNGQSPAQDGLALFRGRRVCAPVLDRVSQSFGTFDKVANVLGRIDAAEAAEGEVDGVSGAVDARAVRRQRERPRGGLGGSSFLCGHALASTNAARALDFEIRTNKASIREARFVNSPVVAVGDGARSRADIWPKRRRAPLVPQAGQRSIDAA